MFSPVNVEIPVFVSVHFAALPLALPFEKRCGKFWSYFPTLPPHFTPPFYPPLYLPLYPLLYPPTLPSRIFEIGTISIIEFHELFLNAWRRRMQIVRVGGNLPFDCRPLGLLASWSAMR